MKQHLPVREVASKLACSEWQVRQMIRAGRLTAVNIGTGSRPSYRIDPQQAVTELSAREER